MTLKNGSITTSCDFRAGAPGVRFLYYGRTTKLRFSSQSSGSTFPSLRSYYEVAIFEPKLREYASCTTVTLQSCDFRAGAPGVRFLYYGCTTNLDLPLLRVTKEKCSGQMFSPNDPRSARSPKNTRFMNTGFLQNTNCYMCWICARFAGFLRSCCSVLRPFRGYDPIILGNDQPFLE